MDDYLRTNRRRLDDFEWVLAPETLPVFQGVPNTVDAEALESWMDKKPLLVLLHEASEPTKIVRLALIAASEKRQHIDALKREAARHGLTAEILKTSDDSDTTALLVSRLPSASKPIADSLIARIFSLFLVTGRPLRHYDCTFMLPLDLRLSTDISFFVRKDLEFLTTVGQEPELLATDSRGLNTDCRR